MNHISESMWDEVTILRKKKQHKVDKIKAQRDGKTETYCKTKGMEEIHKNRKLHESTDAQKHNLVPIETSKAIMTARCQKKLTQDKLAQSLNIKKQVIVEYETGKAILNKQLLSKIKKKLGINK
jgi:ribosome-binding protein aMBF1 (putative translation factor)